MKSIISFIIRVTQIKTILRGWINKLWYIHSMAFYLSIKWKKYWYIQQLGWISKALHWVKDARCKWVYIVWFYLYETLQKTNIISHDRKPISGCRRWSGGLGWVTKELFEGNGNFLYIDCGGGYKVCVCQNSLNYTNR